MRGLYKKILNARPRRIHRRYSDELAKIVNSLLEKNPRYRPSCEQILSDPEVVKYDVEESMVEYQMKQCEHAELMQTIKVPYNLNVPFSP